MPHIEHGNLPKVIEWPNTVILTTITPEYVKSLAASQTIGAY
jgi:hypothetical protein